MSHFMTIIISIFQLNNRLQQMRKKEFALKDLASQQQKWWLKSKQQLQQKRCDLRLLMLINNPFIYFLSVISHKVVLRVIIVVIFNFAYFTIYLIFLFIFYTHQTNNFLLHFFDYFRKRKRKLEKTDLERSVL